MTAPEPLAWLDALADTHSKATKGEWWVADDGVTVEIRGSDGESVRDKHGFYAADAAAIVGEHNAMPELLALARERHELRDVLSALFEAVCRGDEYGMPEAYRAASRVLAATALAGPQTADEEADRD